MMTPVSRKERMLRLGWQTGVEDTGCPAAVVQMLVWCNITGQNLNSHDEHAHVLMFMCCPAGSCDSEQ